MMHRFIRARMLMDQARYSLAEQELRLALIDQPNEFTAHSLLALCLSYQVRQVEALQEAKLAVHLAPDDEFAHYILAVVLNQSKQYDQAEQSAREAIRLDPDEVRNWEILASIHVGREKWQDAVEAAAAGLERDPSNVTCLNFRALAELKLGKRSTAVESFDAALSNDPENEHTHAGKGWTLLHGGRHKEALNHFKEALRIDPNLDHARSGVAESMMAHNWLYRHVLRYHLWLGRKGRKWAWGILGVAFLIMFVVGRLQRAYPEWALELQIIESLAWGALILAFLSDTFFIVMLRFDPVGRLALSPGEQRYGVAAAINLALVACCLAAWYAGVSGIGRMSAWFVVMFMLPLRELFKCDDVVVFRKMLLFVCVLGMAGLTILLWIQFWPHTLRHTRFDTALFWGYIFGCLFADNTARKFGKADDD
jgi:tetratricopeptide (TPR) repeat protein